MFLLAIFGLVLTAQFTSASEDYCQDQESWNEWDALVEKYPNDSDIQTLHALRIGLCLKVQRGDLSGQEASDIFENARESIINKKEPERAGLDRDF